MATCLRRFLVSTRGETSVMRVFSTSCISLASSIEGKGNRGKAVLQGVIGSQGYATSWPRRPIRRCFLHLNETELSGSHQGPHRGYASTSNHKPAAVATSNASPSSDHKHAAPTSSVAPDSHPEVRFSCTVKVIDYSSKSIVYHDVPGSSTALQHFLSTSPRPPWATCRWIYVNGLDPSIVKALGQARDLHRLAIEDVLERSAPSKVDWYRNNCFMVLAWQRLISNGHTHSLAEVFNESAPEVSPNEENLSSIQQGLRQRTKWCSTSSREFGLSSEHVSAFMTADNTLITIFEGAGDIVYNLIQHQLDSSRTILRSSNDPSMLLHAIIDAVVDLAVPIERAIAQAFAELEAAVLENPDIKQSKELYRLRSALTILMDDISAIGAVVKSLCDHQEAPKLSRPDDVDDTTSQEVLIPISPLAKIYLQDVNDHITMLANATLRGVHSAENLTSLIFNTITARQNGSVQRLTIVSIFFLPLTFLTGYFGMNFESMPSVNENTESFFWVIAGPVMLGTLIMLVPSPRWLSWLRRGGKRRRSGNGGWP